MLSKSCRGSTRHSMPQFFVQANTGIPIIRSFPTILLLVCDTGREEDGQCRRRGGGWTMATMPHPLPPLKVLHSLRGSYPTQSFSKDDSAGRS